MRSPRLPKRCAVAVLLCTVGLVSARAELLKVSPFLPPSGPGAGPAATANAPLVFGGTMQVGDVQQFRINDPARKVGSWLKIGERDANLDVVVKQYEASNDTVTIEHGSQTLTLQLKAAKVVSSGAAPVGLPTPPPVAMPNVSPAVMQTVVPNPTPADEQRRLEAVAAEVARRRALREQAAQQAQLQAQGGSGLPTPLPQQPNVTRQDIQGAMQQIRR